MPFTALGGSAGTVTVGDVSLGLFPQALHPNVMAYVAGQSSIGYAMSINEIDAVNNLVWGMVGSGLWDKMQVIYPCIGNNAASFKWNLKNTSSFNITFLGSWTFASTGMKIASASRSNYGRTGYTPSTSGQVIGSAHASIYLRNFYLATSPLAESVFGCYGQFNQQGTLIGVSHYVANSSTMTCQNTTPTSSGVINLSGYSGGMLTVNRNTSGAYSVATLNGTEKSVNLGATSSNVGTLEMWVGMANIAGGTAIPQPQEIAFATIGLGLSRLDIESLYDIVQAFQTKLGRQV
jgi:hypothetical protein